MDRFLLGNLNVTDMFFYFWIFSSGDLTQWSHLITFRTQKLSAVVAMILYWKGKVASRQN